MKINCCIIVTCLFYFSPFWKSKFPPDDAYRADTRKLGCKKTIPEDFLLTLQNISTNTYICIYTYIYIVAYICIYTYICKICRNIYIYMGVYIYYVYIWACTLYIFYIKDQFLWQKKNIICFIFLAHQTISFLEK